MTPSSSGVAAVRLTPQQRRRRGSISTGRTSRKQEQQEWGANRCSIARQQPQADASAGGSSRRRKLIPAAVLSLSAALLMLSSDNNNNSSNLRLSSSSRKLSENNSPARKLVNGGGEAIIGNRKLIRGDSYSLIGKTLISGADHSLINGEAINGTTSTRRVLQANEKISPTIAETVQQLAQPFLEDQANIFAVDGNDPRPVINTFFAIPEGQKIKKVDAETLAVWKQAWSSAGWNPRILSIKDAEAHPEYADIVAKLDKDVPLGESVFYDKSCYLRHFAMAALGGGWMTDYDTVPLNMKAADYGREFPNEGQFTTYEGNVPSVIVGSGEEWDRVSKALLREGVDAGANEDVGLVREGKPRLFSDMYALGELVRKEEVIVNNPHSVFQAHESDRTMATEIMAWDLDVMAEYLDRGTALQQHCEETKYIMALHFSHAATASFGYLPNDRPILIAAFLDRWSKLCGGSALHFDDVASPEASAEGTATQTSAEEAKEVPSTSGAEVSSDQIAVER